MALQQFTNLNFEDIKSSIKDYIRENSNFTDMDFEGSNLSVLINLLAYNSYSTAYNTNMVVNETFIDSATLRENVVSLARNIGYVPRSRRAAITDVSYNISDLPADTTVLKFEPGIIGNGNVDNINYVFSIPEQVTGTALNGEAEGILRVFQGQFLSNTFIIDDSQPNQRFILPNDGIDTSTIRVNVRENASSTTIEEYALVDNILGITSTSKIYLIQETTDEKYEILFGDGIFGKKLSNGNVVDVTYIKTNGKDGNGVSRLSFTGTLSDENDATISDFTATIIPNYVSENGDDIENLQSIRYYAPRLYSTQHRAVTASDYEAIVPSVYPNIESISAFGGEELTPPRYGQVYIAAKPKNGSFLSDFTKKQILSSLKNYSVAGILPTMIDLKFLYVEIDSYVYYNANFVGDPENMKTDVINSLTSFASGPELNKFGGRFKYSKVLSLIDNVSTTITSNITTVRMRKDLFAKINQFTQYEICYENEFHIGADSYNIKSTGFTVSGIPDTVYFSDKRIEGTDKGNIFLFSLQADNTAKVLSNTFGTVDYKKGEVLINTANITSTVKPNNIVEVQAIPESNDVLGRKELYLQFSVANSNFFMREDSIASGANTSGTRFNIQSSYSNGTKVRGDIITSTSSGTLVGYVNGQPYYGAFHFHPNTGKKMVGAVHVSTPHDVIYDTLEQSLGGTFSSTPIDSSSTMSSTSSSSSSSTSSSSSSSSSSSGYGY